MHDGDVGFGWWLVMMLGMLVFWGALIALVVWVLRGGATPSRAESAPAGEPSAHEILDRRLADGSIDVEEYERRRRLLDDAGSGGGSAPQRPNVLGGQA
jgi:putative membrane protein